MSKFEKRFLNPFTLFGSCMLTLMGVCLNILFVYGLVFAEQIAKPGMAQQVRIGAIVHMLISVPCMLLFIKNIIIYTIYGEPKPDESPYFYRM